MTEMHKKPIGKDEIPMEKRVMEVILNVAIIGTMIYFFLLIVAL